jgi:hypothetical protein
VQSGEKYMPVIRAVPGRRNVLRDEFMLSENPFRISEIYNIDEPGTYEPLMYGKQYEEFYEKFFVAPLTKDKNRQMIGAIWSDYSANRLGKGYGKSMIMAEESKRINRDLGASQLRRIGISAEDIALNPFVSGYCSFKEASEVKSFPAALLEAVTFILRSDHEHFVTVHQALRQRISERINLEPGSEGESIRQALETEIRKYRSLGVQLTHKEVRAFIDHLCSDDTALLISRIGEIGPRIKAAQGFNFVHIFNAFLRLAGVEYVVYFIDQIENFAKYARRQDQNIRILRESICETAPTREMASFIFQMHIQAQHAIEDWWDNIEHLPSLDQKKKINSTRIVDLKGLNNKREARLLAEKYLSDHRISGAKQISPLHPFSEDIIEQVRRSESGNPRQFLQKLGAILDHAERDGRVKLDLAYVQPLLEEIPEGIDSVEEDEEYVNTER